MTSLPSPLLTKKQLKENKKALKKLRYNPMTSLAVVAGVFVMASLGATLAVSIIPFLIGMSQAEINDWLVDSLWAQFFLFVVSSGLMVGGIYWFLQWRKQSLDMIGVRRPRWQDALYGGLAFLPYWAALIFVITIVATFVKSVDVNQAQELITAPVAGYGLVLAFISLVILPPLVEEFLFRGFLYTGLRQKLSFIWTTLVVSIIFGSLHLTASSDGPLWIAAIDTATLSFFLCYLREKTGAIWAGVTLHFVKNFIAFIVLFVIK